MPRKNRAEFSFASEPGDIIGRGLSRKYTQFDSEIRLHRLWEKNSIEFSIKRDPDDYWYLEFAAPKGQRLHSGTYKNATRYPFHADHNPGLAVHGSGRKSDEIYGEFTIRGIRFNRKGELVFFEADFVQHSGQPDTPALKGKIYFYRAARQKLSSVESVQSEQSPT